MEKVARESWLFGLVGLLAGVLIGVFIASQAVNAGNTSMMRMMGMQSDRQGMGMMGEHEEHHGGDMTMAGMVDSLSGKSGDAFDETFLTAMIEHHEGAIEMARHAQRDAKHKELKDLADDIVETQTAEIGQMREWMRQWNY